ncbi:hypothetical protein BTN49_1153 [Candidatus Enterovibrio escicola]|uniref:Uncharacterized protein n=1 Tax=Candidatus Enterovibrio escicola TaxID=1927127 RepID=A0A2A5T4Q6_9GAMM|nr:hypothetical protein BTN49_1153 [Candidatus Enterovibrio escacola]
MQITDDTTLLMTSNADSPRFLQVSTSDRIRERNRFSQ